MSKKGLLADMLWSDPRSREAGKPDYKGSDRGAGHTFSEKAVKQFCENNNIDMVCRSG